MQLIFLEIFDRFFWQVNEQAEKGAIIANFIGH